MPDWLIYLIALLIITIAIKTFFYPVKLVSKRKITYISSSVRYFSFTFKNYWCFTEPIGTILHNSVDELSFLTLSKKDFDKLNYARRNHIDVTVHYVKHWFFRPHITHAIVHRENTK